MRQLQWWMPKSSDDPSGGIGTLLSHRWVQTFVYPLPPLKPREMEASLRYKVQATLPVKIDNVSFHTHVFRRGKQTCGAAFLTSEIANEQLPTPARHLRVGVPLVLPPRLPPQALLFLSTPEGLVPHSYEDGILKTSFAPIDPNDVKLRARILAKCPGAEVIGLAPDSKFPLPEDLSDKEPGPRLRGEILNAFPLLETRPPRKYPLVVGPLMLAVGIGCSAVALWNAWSAREARNEAWKAWLSRTQVAQAAPSSRDQTAVLLKARGAPVPELFARLSHAWGPGTRIIDLEWTQGKLTLIASSPSGLESLRQLTADPWFRGIRVDGIRAQKDGTEIFTVEGALQIDF